MRIPPHNERPRAARTNRRAAMAALGTWGATWGTWTALGAGWLTPGGRTWAQASATAPAASDSPAPAGPSVVSAGAGTTEIVYALGAQAQLLAVDTSSLYPPQAQALPKVGYQRMLSAEGVLSLRPQVLLAGDEAGPPAVLRQLEDAGVRVVRVRGDYSFEGVIERIRTAAQVLERQPQARELEARLRQQWQAVAARMAARPLLGASGQPLKVAFLMRQGASTLGAGDDTPAAAVLRMVGAANAFGGAFSGFKPVSAEALVAAAPEAVVGTANREPSPADRAALLATPGLELTPAGRQGRATVQGIVRLLGFGPRLPEAVQALHDALSA